MYSKLVSYSSKANIPGRNIAVDWEKLQGMYNAADEVHQIRRTLNARHIRIDNGSETPVRVAISTSLTDFEDSVIFDLHPLETRDIGINTSQLADQFLHILSPENSSVIGFAKPLHTGAEIFVLREGLNGWFTQTFRSAGVSYG